MTHVPECFSSGAFTPVSLVIDNILNESHPAFHSANKRQSISYLRIQILCRTALTETAAVGLEEQNADRWLHRKRRKGRPSPHRKGRRRRRRGAGPLPSRPPRPLTALPRPFPRPSHPAPPGPSRDGKRGCATAPTEGRVTAGGPQEGTGQAGGARPSSPFATN